MANPNVIRKRIALAEALVKKLNTHMTITSANRGMAQVTDSLGLTDHAQRVQRVYSVWAANPDFVGVQAPNASVIGSSVDEAAGNCDMRAEITYQLAYNMPHPTGTANTKFMKVIIPGHAFCLICDVGIVTTGANYNVAHFGEDAVICDGWQSDYYAPNVWWPYGRIPGIEALVTRREIADNPISVYKQITFFL